MGGIPDLPVQRDDLLGRERPARIATPLLNLIKNDRRRGTDWVIEGQQLWPPIALRTREKVDSGLIAGDEGMAGLILQEEQRPLLSLQIEASASVHGQDVSQNVPGPRDTKAA